MRILIIEDDAIVGDALREGLRQDGHTVDWLDDGNLGRPALDGNDFDVVVLDLALPGMSGLEVLRAWRKAGKRVPVLALTAYGQERGCVELLDAGADDYLLKLVDIPELEARLRALMRRARGYGDNRLVSGNLMLDRSDHIAWLDSRQIDLSAFEFTVLEALLERPGRVLSRDQLEARLYGWEDGPESNSFHVLIHKLRARIGHRRIETVRGMGYRLVAEST